MKTMNQAGRLFFLLALLGIVGCAGKGDVSGKVTVNGKPVVAGSVTFVASDQLAYQSEIMADGSYRVSKVPVGPAKIGVASPKPGQPLSAREKAILGDRVQEPTKATVDPKTWFPIPAEYEDFHKSGITLTVKSGNNEFNIELKPK
jgi:hypothetical protein